MKTIRVCLVAVIATGLWQAAPSSAQPLGTYRWQLQPYCNVIHVTLVQQGSQYQLDGIDDQCGAPQAAGVRGLAFLNPNGTVGFGLSIVTAPGGTPVHVDATITVATLSGTWRDSAGNTGSFTFTPGAGSGGAPRPVPSGGLAPASVTNIQIAPGAVNGASIANGSITIADLAAPPSAAFTSGEQSLALTGGDQIVRALDMTLPGPGIVLVTASGSVGFDSAARDSAICSVVTGVAHDSDHAITAAEETGGLNALRFVPFSYTRGFSMAAGARTFRLVCRVVSGSINIIDSSLTAVFVPVEQLGLIKP